MPIAESEVQLDGQRAISFRPESPSTGGVLLLPTNAGPDKSNRYHSRCLAEAGLTTLLWDPYAGKGLPPDDERSKWSAAVGDDWAITGLSRLLTYMAEEMGVERAGCLGFCMGGRYSLLLAAMDHRVAALASFYPTIRRPTPATQKYDAVAIAAEIRCPATVVCPGQDHITTQEVYADLRETLRERDQPTVAHVYPDAAHGFMQARKPEVAVKMAWTQAVVFMTANLL
ncbi:MAG TPA: dienelactone hydrolase family protein [Chloroflexota bacterium]|nr:dienelactone hydrolase family protein [Chloroflexota bacterium]